MKISLFCPLQTGLLTGLNRTLPNIVIPFHLQEVVFIIISQSVEVKVNYFCAKNHHF